MSFGFGFALPHWQTLSGGFSPAGLFAGGTVQGAWYDPSDSTTIFEDTAGTTPSPTPGGGALSVVGLMLDKSQGLALGPELVTNGDFSSGTTTGWTALSGGLLSVVSGQLKVENSGTFGRAYQAVTVTANQWYEVRTIAVAGTANATIRFGNSGAGSTQYVNAVNTTGTFVWRFYATTTTIDVTLYCESATVGATVFFDNISIKALPGNHAISYNTTTARPELSARVNLLTYSEQFNNAAWNIQTNLTFTTGVTDPNGGSTAMTITATVGSGRLLQSVTTGNNVTSTASIWIRRRTGTGDINWEAVGVGVGPLINVTSTWQRATYTATVLSGSIFYYGIRIATVGDAVDIAFGDIRPTNIGASVPAYQRIADQYTYDSSGFPRYLVFNGTASGMYTPANLNLIGTDKVTVFAGVRKISDAARGLITELSATAGNVGTFVLEAPSTPSGADYRFGSGGSLPFNSTATATGLTAPISNVVTGFGNISGDLTRIRVNGVQVGTGTNDQGTGNYGTYPLYVGSRNNSSLFLNGYIYSLIVVGAASTAAQISSTESWINVKEGGVY